MPAIVLQPITGALLMHILGVRFDSAWFLAIALLYVVTGLCWIPVVFIQHRLRDLARTAASYAALPPEFHRMMRWWIVLGVPAFTAVLLIVVLMVTHVGMTVTPSADTMRAEVLPMPTRWLRIASFGSTIQMQALP